MQMHIKGVQYVQGKNVEGSKQRCMCAGVFVVMHSVLRDKYIKKAVWTSLCIGKQAFTHLPFENDKGAVE